MVFWFDWITLLIIATKMLFCFSHRSKVSGTERYLITARKNYSKEWFIVLWHRQCIWKMSRMAFLFMKLISEQVLEEFCLGTITC